MDERQGGRQADRRVPVAAIILGGAGLLPPVLALLVRLTTGGGGDPRLAQFATVVGLQYAALILSFLGGLWWGIAAARLPADRVAPLLLLSVVPSLVAFALNIASNWFPGPTVVLLALAFPATLLVDRRLQADGLAPRWWMRLRVPLSFALALVTLGFAALL